MIPFARIVNYGNKAPKPLPIKKVLTSNYNVYVLMSSGKLYVRGQNARGMLGLGHSDPVLSWALSTESVKDIWVGEQGALIQLFDNTYWYAGDNIQVGMVGTLKTVWTDWTVRSTLIAPIKDIAMSNNTISVLLDDGSLWAAGGGQFGQLGNNSTTNNILGQFVRCVITESTLIPDRIFAKNTMHGFISTTGKLAYTGTVNAVNTGGGVMYTSYTTNSTTYNSGTVLQYMNNTNSLSSAVVKDNTGVNRLYYGGARIFGQMADGVDGSVSNIRQFAISNANPAPSGDILRVAEGNSYYAQFVVTSTGIYCAGRNIGDSLGALSTGVASNALYFTACVLPSGLDLNAATVQCCQFKTYLTDGNLLYSSGSYVRFGGTASTTFTLDHPTG